MVPAALVQPLTRGDERGRCTRAVASILVSTRTYIVLAALTGLVILAAFAVQLARS